MTAALARTAALLAAGAIASACGRAAPSGFAEGRVEVSGDAVTLDRQQLPDAVPEGVREDLKHLHGVEVGVAFEGSTATIVNPIDDDWRVVLQGVNRTTSANANRLDGLTAAYSDVERQFSTIATNAAPPTGVESLELAKRYGILQTAAYEAAGEAADESQRSAFLNLASESGQRMVMSYPESMRYPEDLPERVASTQAGAVAITRNGTLLGSGFLVSQEWVVTNRHVMDAISDAKLAKVRFAEHKRTNTPSRECPVVASRAAGKPSALDLAAVRIRCTPPIRREWVLSLATRLPGHNEMLYIHGYFNDESNKNFFIPALVRYPHQVSGRLHEGLRRGISSASARALFERFYSLCRPDSADWCYFSSPARWNRSGGDEPTIPTMGFDSNTGPGSSGSPVISTVDHQVVGVFFAGAANPNVNEPYSFERHEAAIPSPLVLEWLRAEKILP